MSHRRVRSTTRHSVSLSLFVCRVVFFVVTAACRVERCCVSWLVLLVSCSAGVYTECHRLVLGRVVLLMAPVALRRDCSVVCCDGCNGATTGGAVREQMRHLLEPRGLVDRPIRSYASRETGRPLSSPRRSYLRKVRTVLESRDGVSAFIPRFGLFLSADFQC